LNENLIMELEDKKKQIENERHTIELTGGVADVCKRQKCNDKFWGLSIAFLRTRS